MYEKLVTEECHKKALTLVTPRQVIDVAPKLLSLIVESKRAAIRTAAAKCFKSVTNLSALVPEAWKLFTDGVADEALASLATVAGSEAGIEVKEAASAAGKTLQSKLD